MQEKTSTFTVRDPRGQAHQVQGDPARLTLRDVLDQVPSAIGKTGGERDLRFRSGEREYQQSDLGSSLRELGIQPGSTIEIVSPEPA